jgi:hypothetical protein
MNPVAFVLIASHGITDLLVTKNMLALAVTYAGYIFASFFASYRFVILLFLLHSAWHFSYDFRSKMLSTSFVILLATMSQSRSELFFQIYMVCVHLPQHYKNVWPALTKYPGLSVGILASTHLLFSLAVRKYGCIIKNQKLLRLGNAVICAHVALSYLCLKV